MSLKPVKRTRLYRRLAAIAASLVIVIGLFVTVPPLRTFAQEIMNYFVPGPYTQPTEEEMAATASESVSVDTVAEAEAIAGFDVLEWTRKGYETFGISASKTFVSLNYEKVMPPPVHGGPDMILLSQEMAGTYNETEPVGDKAYVQTVTVNGVEGEYVQGIWYGKDNVEWNPDDYRQLRWQKGDIIYRVIVSTHIADTPEEVVALAESLK